MPTDASAHSVPTGMVAELVHLAERWGVAPEELLAGTGVAAAELQGELSRVPLPRYLAALRRAIDLTGEPGLGFCIGLQARASAFGHLAFAAATAGTVRQAIELCIQFEPMISTAMGLRLRVEGEIASLLLELHADFGDLAEVVVIGCLSGLWNVARALTGQDLNGTAEMTFAEPAYHARFSQLVPATRYRQPTNRIVMRSQALDVPLLMADPQGLRVATQRCEEELESLSLPGRWVRRVRDQISRHADSAGVVPSVESLAAGMHMAARTLSRKLEQQGHSLSSLLDQERRHRALVLLRRSPAVPVDAVASQLGYTTLRSFVRAFRRWTGTTPTAYRKEAGLR